MITPKGEVVKQILADLNDLLERYKEKNSLIQAAETHGEELDEDFIADKIEELEQLIASVNDVTDDLSYIE